MQRSMRTLFLLGAVAVPLAAQAPRAAQPDYAAAMKHEHGRETPTASPIARIAPRTAVTGVEVMYGMVDGKMLHGYLAKPAGVSRGGPALIVVHEWWGLNDNIKAIADRYAGEGFTVLAVDLFGRVATTPDTAMVLYQAAMKDVTGGEKNLAAGIAYLKAQDVGKIGSVGYCFGGHWSLRTGLVGGTDIKAVTIYYGAPITEPSQLQRLTAPVLGLYGGLDKGIPVDSVRAMERVMKSEGRTVSINVYATADHGFSNPSGQAYNAAAATDAWTKSLAFFRANLR
ncbi:MAG: dienelactone hydrolase family protein [Gemmatimonadaceae bacterium]|nr:dienelactone hydrolase family protein [Gemmatimonadaceae bacterium]